MRDYKNLAETLRFCATNGDCNACPSEFPCGGTMGEGLYAKAADAIEELLAFARSVARRAVDAQDDEVSAEVLCRKLYKLGIIEKDGAWWHYEPPKDEKADDKEERPNA